MDIYLTLSMLNITYKCLFFVTIITCNYFIYEIKDDGSLKFVMATIFNASFVNSIDLYIEKMHTIYVLLGKISLSKPCISPPSSQCTPPSSDPLHHHKFSAPVNESRLVSLLGSTSQSSQSQDFGSISKNCHKSSQLIPESMVGGKDSIDS